MATTPYTYLIGWSQHNKWYYGVRFVDGCDPSDLWESYFTSSKYVKQFREDNGEPDIIQIRKTFSDKESARLYESNVLKRLHVVNNDKWLNRTDNKAIKSMPGENNPFYKRKHTPEANEKNRIAHLGKKQSPETISKKVAKRIGQKQTEYQKQRAKEGRQLEWDFIDPQGNKIHVLNLLQFCRENGLDQGNMTKVHKGEYRSCKGWTKG